jgi:23S rRNA pseudouridine1911/1915/1917 synthase
MAHIGHALIGDPVYGGRRRLKADAPGAEAARNFPRQALHAATLGFIHPVTGEEMSFTSPLPEDFSEILDALRG